MGGVFYPKGFKKVPDSEFRRCAAAGMSRSETARELGISEPTVTRWKKAHPRVKWQDHRIEAVRAAHRDPVFRAKALKNLIPIERRPDHEVGKLWAARRRRLAIVEQAFATQQHDTFTEIGVGKAMAKLAAREAEVARQLHAAQRRFRVWAWEGEEIDEDDIEPLAA
jgi:transcriptional regulator with XRE-family HTH domain